MQVEIRMHKKIRCVGQDAPPEAEQSVYYSFSHLSVAVNHIMLRRGQEVNTCSTCHYPAWDMGK